MEVDQLHAARVRQTGVARSGQFELAAGPDVRFDGRRPQQPTDLVRRERAVAAAEVSVLEVGRGAPQVVGPAERGPGPSQPGGQRPHGTRQPSHAVDREGLAVDAVAAEQLVRALARQDDGHVLAGSARQEVYRERRRVGDWLVEVPRDIGKRTGEVVRRHRDLMVVRADALRHLPRPLELIEILEADGEGLERPAARGPQFLLRERGDDGAVDAAAEERADRHVADQVTGNRLLHRGADLRRQHLRVLLCGVVERVSPVAVDLHATGGDVHGGECPRRQPVNAREERLGQRVVLQGQVVDQGIAVQRPGAGAIGEQGLDLGREGEEHAVGGQPVVERLNAEGIAREDEPAARLVVDGQREHPAHGAQHLGEVRMAACRVQPQDHLGIASRHGRHVLQQRVLRDLSGVVDLAVADDAQVTVRRPHRLPATLAVDDRETGRADREIGADERARVIGAAVLDGLQHPRDQRRRALGWSEDSGDAAHADLHLSSKPSTSSHVVRGERGRPGKPPA